MPFCGKSKPLRPVGEYTQYVDGRLCRCVRFCMHPAQAPALLQWMEQQKEPVLGLYRSAAGTVSVYLGMNREETDG